MTDSGRRVLYSQTKPYAAPLSLNDLHGPVGGVVELPITVTWSPAGRTLDLGTLDGVHVAYHALLNEGTTEQQCAFLDAATLIDVWPQLILPERVRVLWETRFPVLRDQR